MNNVTKVTCIQASQCAHTGKRIYTLECEYPRVIHAQLLTHGVFSKNSSSTRAVPLLAAIAQIKENPAQYIWTMNQAGMQGKLADTTSDFEHLFSLARADAMHYAEALVNNGAHKQNAGRLLEPFQNIKIVLTSTEWENWDWLRLDPDAQGEIADLAIAMKEARDNADIMLLKAGEWHVPYVDRYRCLEYGNIFYSLDDEDQTELSVDEAKAVSSSVCAQTSYRKADYSLEKALKMRGMLIDGRKVHASPFEHQATPILPYNEDRMGLFKTNDPYDFETWEDGITHMHRDTTFGSGNFKGWIQHRQLIVGHDKALF